LGFPTGRSFTSLITRQQVLWHYSSPPHQQVFLAPLPGRKKTSARGVSHAHPLLCFKFCFTLFLLASLYQKHKKICILDSCFYLSAFSFARMATPENTKLCDFTSTNNSDFICTPIALLLQIFMRLSLLC
jgi:hypothetical protein